MVHTYIQQRSGLTRKWQHKIHITSLMLGSAFATMYALYGADDPRTKEALELYKDVRRDLPKDGGSRMGSYEAFLSTRDAAEEVK